MSARRRLATLASVGHLIKKYGALRLWTFTRADHAGDLERSVDDVLASWKRIAEWLARRGLCGVCVIEQHDSGVLHFHALIPYKHFFNIREYLAFAVKHGFGRVHYDKKSVRDNGVYACKYLSKQSGPDLKGKRLVRYLNRHKWDVVGQRDIVFDSPIKRSYEAFKESHVGELSKDEIFDYFRVARFLDLRGMLGHAPFYWRQLQMGNKSFFCDSGEVWAHRHRWLNAVADPERYEQMMLGVA